MRNRRKILLRAPGEFAGSLTATLRSQSGSSLIEVLVALAIFGVVAVAFLGGLTTASRAGIITDERATGESLARSQMEWIKNTAYVHSVNGYAPPMPSGADYTNYTAVNTAQPLHNPDDGIQKITIVVSRLGKEVFRLESYKVSR